MRYSNSLYYQEKKHGIHGTGQFYPFGEDDLLPDNSFLDYSFLLEDALQVNRDETQSVEEICEVSFSR